MKNLLIIAHVWPEPESSAAGVRTQELTRAFSAAGWTVNVASPCKDNPAAARLRAQGFFTHALAANDASADTTLKALSPDVVIYDRYMVEEMFGFKVRAACPGALQILDTIDLHFLRKARQSALESGVPLNAIFAANLDLQTDDALREIAAMYRCDLTLVLSSFEMDLLVNRLGVPQALLHDCGIGYPTDPRETPTFESRAGYVAIGGYRHAPNADGTRWLVREIWPKIRTLHPDARLHLCGAYPPKEISELASLRDGIEFHGPVPDAVATLSKHRVNLAPLRFGAGIKGKILDGWRAGTPVVTTPIGAEGMGWIASAWVSFWGGRVVYDAERFALEATRVYHNRELWELSQIAGDEILRAHFDRETIAASLLSRIEKLRRGLTEHRRSNFVGRMLNHHHHRSTEYFSRWIEAKNRTPNPGAQSD